MTLTPHTITPHPRSKRSVRRLGRGHGSGRGKSAGRGTKGQRARTGGKSRTAIRAFKKMLQKIPKLRGDKPKTHHPLIVTLSTLERCTKSGMVVTPFFLKKKGVIGTADHGVKVLATGAITKAITLKGCLASKEAALAIEKSGGKVVF